MTFLNPAVLLGLIAAAIPIVLHFLNLRKLKTIEFSTLAFLKELQKTKIRRIKLKQWLLLLLRVLIILFLVLAFARPTLKNISFGDSSAAKTTVVIILDNTFSMSIIGEKGSRLNNFKQIAKNLLANFQPGDEVAVIAVGDLKVKNVSASGNFASIKKEIDDLEISNVSGTLNEAMLKASQILYSSKNYNKEIYLLSDLQKGRIVNTSSEISGFGKTISPDTRLYLFNGTPNEIVNLGIDDVKPNNQLYEVGKEVSFSALVKNYSISAVNDNVVSFFINGKRTAQKNISLAGNETKEISFETTLQDTGLVEFSAELEDDAVLQDNKRFFSVYITSDISLLLLSDRADDTKFVKLALGIPNQKIKLTELRTEQISSVNPQKFDAVILIGVDKISDTKALANYLTTGGNIIVMPGAQSTLAGFQKFSKELGLPTANAIVGKAGSPDSFTQFAKTDFQHPLLKNIFEEKTKTQIESPEIFCYFKIFSGSNGKNIISLADNSSFISEYNVGKGKVLLYSSAPVLSWNTFPMKAFFAPLIAKSLLYCSVKENQDSSIVCGKDALADISNSVSQQIKVTTPSDLDDYFSTDSLSNKKYLSYLNTNETGTYKVLSGNKLLDYFSVNHDPRESVLESASETEFEDYLKQIGYEGKFISLSTETDYLKEIYQSRFGTELWKYFLIIVLLLAIAESL
ncbi:MAG: BatA and WFA domain-containing protein, partial [Ignavibacteria bacterium]|nr:BatA and WFA domain-containing protein [Ignavibacteria bacterium]